MKTNHLFRYIPGIVLGLSIFSFNSISLQAAALAQQQHLQAEELDAADATQIPLFSVQVPSDNAAVQEIQKSVHDLNETFRACTQALSNSVQEGVRTINQGVGEGFRTFNHNVQAISFDNVLQKTTSAILSLLCITAGLYLMYHDHKNRITVPNTRLIDHVTNNIFSKSSACFLGGGLFLRYLFKPYRIPAAAPAA